MTDTRYIPGCVTPSGDIDPYLYGCEASAADERLRAARSTWPGFHWDLYELRPVPVDDAGNPLPTPEGAEASAGPAAGTPAPEAASPERDADRAEHEAIGKQIADLYDETSIWPRHIGINLTVLGAAALAVVEDWRLRDKAEEEAVADELVHVWNGTKCRCRDVQPFTARRDQYGKILIGEGIRQGWIYNDVDRAGVESLHAEAVNCWERARFSAALALLDREEAEAKAKPSTACRSDDGGIVIIGRTAFPPGITRNVLRECRQRSTPEEADFAADCDAALALMDREEAEKAASGPELPAIEPAPEVWGVVGQRLLDSLGDTPAQSLGPDLLGVRVLAAVKAPVPGPDAGVWMTRHREAPWVVDISAITVHASEVDALRAANDSLANLQAKFWPFGKTLEEVTK